MRFVYSPEGAEPRTWPFNPDKLMSPEAEAIERHTGMTFGEWKQAVSRDSMTAIRGLLFVLLKRSTPTLKWEEVQFCLDEVAIELDDDDKVEIRDQLHQKVRAGVVLDADEAEVYADLVAEIGPAPEPPSPEDQPVVSAGQAVEDTADPFEVAAWRDTPRELKAAAESSGDGDTSST